MRAPLTSIQGLIQLMEMSNDLPELKNYVTMLKGRAHSLEVFIGKISEYAQSGRQEEKWEKVILYSSMRECLENLRFYPHAHKIKVLLEIPDHLEIMSDAFRLQVIFGNLFSNAIKYHDFTKADPYIRIRHELLNGKIKIHIEDNGCGIREESLKSIFGMFYRVHRQVEGTGLGLFIVKEALEKLQGTIEVKSEYGAGTTFSISLPLRPTLEMPS
jgi:signal transduction histidine kinase